MISGHQNPEHKLAGALGFKTTLVLYNLLPLRKFIHYDTTPPGLNLEHPPVFTDLWNHYESPHPCIKELIPFPYCMVE